jgi:Omp85 superfamily domain
VAAGAELGEFDSGRHHIATLLGTLQRDTRDKIVDARSGSLQRLSFEVADFLLGSEASYFTIIGATQWFLPLAWKTVGAVSLQGGIAEAFASTSEVPISRRFFLGGSTTIRGYDYERVGPTAPDGTPTGFDDHLVLRRMYQPEGDEVDRRQALQHLVDHILLRQEGLRTRIVRIAEAEVNRHLDELGQRLEHGYTLVRVLQERGISQQKVRTWLHSQLIVRAFIDRRVRLFIRVTESQIVQYYRDHQQIVGVPLDEAVRE